MTTISFPDELCFETGLEEFSKVLKKQDLLSGQGLLWCILTFHGNPWESHLIYSTSRSFYGEEGDQR